MSQPSEIKNIESSEICKNILEQIESEIKESNRNINPIKKHHATTIGMSVKKSGQG